MDLTDIIRILYGRHDRSFDRRQDECLYTGHYDYAKLNEKNKRFVISKLNQDSLEHLFEQNTVTYIDHEGPKVVETSTAHIAECGHLVGLSEDNTLSSICSICNQVLCSKCSYTHCDKCRSIICKNCSSLIDDKMICADCKFSYVAKKWIFSVLRAIHSLLSAIHNLLSKEF